MINIIYIRIEINLFNFNNIIKMNTIKKQKNSKPLTISPGNQSISTNRRW